ncbi:chromodomain Y-like protein [Stomoxys calcitrans]|uniref:Uncharacterized protein n=1 Tax=Stomoxys calcitrans TaxID=35570 RepID=A0A1I8P7F0_STOCA|nr:chromodomain Y-like protein [Stomoxys calcitrans]XP_013116125.1 chromodomain Y-like protein [Stomoxys calcitrans]XP_013116126.1 chromodomain Y-like protein [Stomoxys calcitrans]XP_013116127.1 chromodomain Y-like protein [Stomoxys calcitrans]
MSSMNDDKTCSGEDADAIVVATGRQMKPDSTDISKIPSPDLKDASDAPRIIGNQLLVRPPTTNSVEHLDDLLSLEQEIAKMHNVDEHLEESAHCNVVATKNASGNDSGNKAASTHSTDGKTSSNAIKDSTEKSEINYEVKMDAIAMGETALEHEDLIAVLKGLDGHNDGGDVEMELEGVTIEGEGEYQIMEVIDDDYSTPEPEPLPMLNAKSSVSGAKKSFGAAVLSTEEERAVALEQMEGLKVKQKPRRRKQDIKPIQQVDPVLDLVSSLEAEWTDNDDDGNSSSNTTKKDAPVPVQLVEAKTNVPQITSVVVIPPNTKQSGECFVLSSSGADSNSNASFKEEESKDVVTKVSPLEGVTITKTDEDSHVMSSHSGFRRTRIIKRKIIWDPDAPETTFSYAKLVSSSKTKIKTEPSIPSTTITKGSTTIRPIKREAPTSAVKKTQPRPITPKEKKTEAVATNHPLAKTSLANQKQPQEINNKTTKKDDESETKLLSDSASSSSSPITDNSPTNKRRSGTPVSNGPGGAKKKKVSEIDRLMGDEGAVNMLNSLEKLGATETKSARPMMRSRAATICEKPPRKETSSPVKISPPAISSQTPKSGKRSGKPRASSSWDYVYKQKQQNIDDSMIIRRRSNSSYSSNASLNRLSLDGVTTPNGANTSAKSSESKSATTPENVATKSSSRGTDETPTSHLHGKGAGAGSKNSPKSFEFAKPENKKAQRRTKSPAAAAGTLANDLKKPAPVANKRNVRSPNMLTDEKSDGGMTLKIPPSASATTVLGKDKLHTSDVMVKKSAKVAQIIFNTNKAKLSFTFTTQMLNKLSDILNKLAADPDTHVTVILTNDAHFCQGIDLTEITVGSTDKRKNAVKHLTTAVRNYLKILASYPKPLIAGVNGHVMNLGVMQLAFFDVVVAGDKCTYETQYNRMGQLPEGYGVWNQLNKIRGSFKTKLFWLSEKIQSTEAALAGLVNKLTVGNKVNDEAINVAKKIASLSPVSFRSMKKTLSESYLEVIDASFDEEFNTIADQWTSNEFLDNIRKYVEQGHF